MLVVATVALVALSNSNLPSQFSSPDKVVPSNTVVITSRLPSLSISRFIVNPVSNFTAFVVASGVVITLAKFKKTLSIFGTLSSIVTEDNPPVGIRISVLLSVTVIVVVSVDGEIIVGSLESLGVKVVIVESFSIGASVNDIVFDIVAESVITGVVDADIFFDIVAESVITGVVDAVSLVAVEALSVITGVVVTDRNVSIMALSVITGVVDADS